MPKSYDVNFAADKSTAIFSISGTYVQKTSPVNGFPAWVRSITNERGRLETYILCTDSQRGGRWVITLADNFLHIPLRMVGSSSVLGCTEGAVRGGGQPHTVPWGRIEGTSWRPTRTTITTVATYGKELTSPVKERYRAKNLLGGEEPPSSSPSREGLRSFWFWDGTKFSGPPPPSPPPREPTPPLPPPRAKTPSPPPLRLVKVVSRSWVLRRAKSFQVGSGHASSPEGDASEYSEAAAVRVMTEDEVDVALLQKRRSGSIVAPLPSAALSTSSSSFDSLASGIPSLGGTPSASLDNDAGGGGGARGSSAFEAVPVVLMDERDLSGDSHAPPRSGPVLLADVSEWLQNEEVEVEDVDVPGGF